MSSYILSAILELKDKFSSNIQKATNEFGKMSNSIDKNVKKSKSSLDQMSSGFDKVALGIKTFITTAIAGAATKFIKDSYSGYLELNDQLTRNAAITGANAKDQAEMTQQVKELGRTTRFTAKQVAEAQMYQAMAGYKTNEILSVTPTLLKLSVATGENLASTSDMITDSLSAFGLSVKDVGMYTDVLANTANNTNTTVGMMGNAFVYVGASSRAMGENFKEVAVLLGVLADNGIKGEKAGTGLNAIYSRLAKVTPKMRAQLEKTNTKLYDQNGKFKGLRTIIEESRTSLSKLSEQERNTWLVTVAGTEGLKIWTSIMNNSTESTKKAENAVYNANGALEKFYSTMASADKQKIEELKSAWNGLQLQVGEGLSPVFGEQATELTKKLNKLADSALLTVDNIEKLGRSIIWLTGKGYQMVGQVTGLSGMKSALGLIDDRIKNKELYKFQNEQRKENRARYIEQGGFRVEKESINEYLKNSASFSGTKSFSDNFNSGMNKNLKYNIPENNIKAPEINIDLSGLNINTSLDEEEIIRKTTEKTGEALKLALFQAKLTQQ
ncbi:phage tail tape measure protein [Fusobacterium varium]|uniref:phage tail tape measure protein n=1 Tax=Fusobacterium TaxID=848 RepID=UPI0030CE47B3